MWKHTKKRVGRDKGAGKERGPADGMKTEAGNDDEGEIELQQNLETVMMRLTNNEMDVAELYSPERVTATARKLGLNAGWSLDFTTTDENGRPWDFECVHTKNKAVRKLLEDKPKLLIGSPMYIGFCSWTRMDQHKMAAEVVQERLRKARAHLEFCMKLYAIQIHHGRYFLHECPQSATSWKEARVQRILNHKEVIHVTADQCQYGLISKGKEGHGAAREATTFMTNAPHVAEQLQKRCPTKQGRIHHRHVTLEGGRRKFAQIYPEGLCRAICRGLIH